MALPPQRDPEVTAKQLTEWLGSRLPAGADVVISNLEIPRTGFSNETFYFDADWTDYDGRHHERLVTRVQPGDHQLFLGADVGTQFRTQVALGSHSPVPLPKMFWHEADPGVLGRAFYVMGRIDGRVPLVLPSYHSGGWVTDLEPAQRELMWQNAMAALVQIAQADARTGFEFLLEDGKQPGLDSYLDWVKSWQEWAVRRRTFPILDAGLEYVLANKPEDDSVSVVWGDAVSTNMIFSDDLSVAGVIDWEMATLGPPEVDLGWWLFFERFLTDGMGAARLEGIPDREQTIKHYESLMGRKVRDIEYYEVLGALRMSIISVRSFDLQIEEGFVSPDTTMYTNNPITQILSGYLGLPIPDLAPEFAAMVERVQNQ